MKTDYRFVIIETIRFTYRVAAKDRDEAERIAASRGYNDADDTAFVDYQVLDLQDEAQ